MALPKITQPEFEITLPVIKKKIKFRPFLVKEEKVLLVGKEGSATDQLGSIVQILKNVVVSPKNFNPNDLTITDIEYLFMHLRGKSVDNLVKLKYKDVEDEKLYDFEVDINNVHPIFNDNRKHEMSVGNLTIELKDPTLSVIKKTGMNLEQAALTEADANTDMIFDLLAHCLVKVWDAEQVYDDFTIDEAKEFLKNIDINSFQQIQKFFETAPRLEHKLQYVNSLGNDREIVLRGLSDFF